MIVTLCHDEFYDDHNRIVEIRPGDILVLHANRQHWLLTRADQFREILELY